VSSRHVPVHMGSPRFQSAHSRAALTTQAWFPPGATLHPHTHERTIFATMLDGSFETAVAGRRLSCVPTTVWTEPAEERHANYIGRLGARVLVVQPDPAHQEFFAPYLSFLSRVNHLRHPRIAADARRIVRELEIDDSLTPLGIDALVVTMLTEATRLEFGSRHHAHRPGWLSRVQDYLHAHVGAGLQLSVIAEIADVHPSHLAHAFRRHFGMSVGAYARQLRLGAALERLASSDTPISEIAAMTGFSDQSHLTRSCRLALGITPAAYRRRSRE